MHPDAQTTTRGFLAVSASALEIANVIQGALEVFWFTFTFIYTHPRTNRGQRCFTSVNVPLS